MRMHSCSFSDRRQRPSLVYRADAGAMGRRHHPLASEGRGKGPNAGGLSAWDRSLTHLHPKRDSRDYVLGVEMTMFDSVPHSPQAVGYLRVSTEEQAREGVSLAAQEVRVRAYCAMRGLELAEVVVDAGVTAGKPLQTRMGGARVIEMVASDAVNAVVAVKLDRLFRDCADCLDVTRHCAHSGHRDHSDRSIVIGAKRR